MRGKHAVRVVALLVLSTVSTPDTSGAQGKTAVAKSLRCTFPLNATGNWKKEGPPEATVKPTALVLVFESIDTDEGTARLRSGSVGSDIVARLSGGYLHFIQS